MLIFFLSFISADWDTRENEAEIKKMIEHKKQAGKIIEGLQLLVIKDNVGVSD